MEYIAQYGIDHGVTHGFGIKYPDYIEREEKITAQDDAHAMQEAFNLAKRFSRDYLSNPETQYTTVKILSITSPSMQRITLRALASDRMEIENGHITVKCSTLEHILLLATNKDFLEE